MSKMKKQGRQGDVLLVRVNKIDEEIEKEEMSHKVILAEGEATGHAHSVTTAEPTTEPKMKIIESKNGNRYLDVEVPATVTHEEHGKIALAPGTYQVIRQKEWTDADEPRNVRD